MKIIIVVLAASLLINSQAGNAQSAPGILTGSIFRPDGTAIAGAPIRARNDATGTDARTRSSESGQFEIENLPAGDYRVTVHMPCCEFIVPFDGVVTVVNERPTEFEIHMPPSNISVEGDDGSKFRDELLGSQVIPESPVPRTSEGRSDLSGVWLRDTDPFPEDARLLEWVGPVVEERIGNMLVDIPSAHCLPGSPPVGSGASFTTKFVQTEDLLIILIEDAPGYRQVFLDGRPLPDNPNPAWMGHSVGHWEGDTLVIETTGFNDRGWTEIFPRTTMLRMEERIRRSDYGHLELEITYDDPGVFAEPLIRRETWDLVPQLEVMEYVCENNQWMDAGR